MPFYLTNKPKNITSNDWNIKVRKLLKVKKSGHSGTLDYFASGLMIIATNHDTKLLGSLLNEKKTYVGEFFFGKQTDTLDPEGTIIEEKEVDIELDDVRKVIQSKFIGSILQTPPIFSAKKINGQRSSDLVRKGVDVSLKPKPKIIYEFTVSKVIKNTFKFHITVSSGTYIRAIARDIGRAMKSPAMLISLKRIAIGYHKLDADSNKDLVPIDTRAFFNFTQLEVDENFIKKIFEGRILTIERNEQLLLLKSLSSLVLVKRVGRNAYIISKRLG